MMTKSMLETRFTSLLKEALPVPNEEDGIYHYSPRAVTAPINWDQETALADYSVRTAYAFKEHATASTEGLYRTVDAILLSNVRRDAPVNILDLGCGTGRTIYDCAALLPDAVFVGMDRSVAMCRRAKQVLTEGQELHLRGLESRGVPNIVFKHSRELPNVKIVQGNAMDLPFRSEVFDFVTGTMLVDRVVDPARVIEEIIRVLKPGGLLVISSALNLTGVGRWTRFGSLEKLADFLTTAGAEVKEQFDGLVYRELIDGRGNFTEWSVCFVLAVKTGWGAR